MNKYICTNCGFAYQGSSAPTICPQCKAPEYNFKIMDETVAPLADEHRVGIVEGISEDVIEALQQEYANECTEIGIHLAMSRQADRDGYPEVASAYKKVALEEADHAARIAEILGEKLFADTQKNLEIRISAEFKDCERKKKIANLTKSLGLDEIHDVMHEMCKDEARHYNIFKGLKDRFF